MECQVEKNLHFRHILLFEFNRGANAAEAAKSICCVYGEGAITERTSQKWFSRFRNSNFDMSDAPRSGRRSNFDEDRLNQLLQENSRQTTRELANEMDVDQATISRHLHKIGKVQKLGSWVPHVLNEHDKHQRVVISSSLLSRHRSALQQHQSFLSRIITGDEKWCLYINFKHRKEWLNPDQQPKPREKPDLHPLKTMLSVWWDQKGVIHYELLERNQTITSEIYCQQLRRLEAAICEKRSEKSHQVILHHDNARPHTAKLTKSVIEKMDWEILPHPAYSPDLAPTDFHLFRSLSNAMRGISFDDDAHLKNWLEEFFSSKTSDFFKRGIQKLPCRWEEVISSGGQYIID